MSLPQNSYYGLQGVGREIWQILAREMTLGDLVGVLVDRFDVSRPECEEQVFSFVEQLVRRRLLMVRHG